MLQKPQPPLSSRCVSSLDLTAAASIRQHEAPSLTWALPPGWVFT